METSQVEICANCARPLPTAGFFCGGCLTQFKCKSCGSFLERDNIGCVFCGAPKDEQASTNGENTTSNINTFHYHEVITEKSTERTINGTYSDNVSKDFAGVLNSKLNGISAGAINNIGNVPDKPANTIDVGGNFQDAEIIKDEKNIRNQDSVPFSSTEYPALRAIAMKNLPNSETEWIVVC